MSKALFGLFAIVMTLATISAVPEAASQTAQGPDLAYSYKNDSPAYASGGGPMIVFSARNSVFVRNGSAKPLAQLAESDGFQTFTSDSTLDDALLAKAGILVIINAYDRDQYRNFPAMTPPSAFSDEEIERVRKWVDGGGNLLVLADHAPLGGGSSKLAEAFGFTFLNGHAAETKSADAGYSHVILDFRPQNGLASDTPVTDGSMGRKPTERFFAFGGQAFIPASGAISLLTIPDGWSAIFSYRIFEEIKTAPRIDASGMSQGAILEYGKGRIGMFGEAGGFTAQISPDGKFGFNTDEGAQNPEFILSLLRWLAHYQPKG
ncbi:MAG: DUF4350 domain-containing protein [Nitratireductor sp.]|nr:DUF4350 domain-containing protein [Nitratireductor sp.]